VWSESLASVERLVYVEEIAVFWDVTPVNVVGQFIRNGGE
jgi:hypothetical protein